MNLNFSPIKLGYEYLAHRMVVRFKLYAKYHVKELVSRRVAHDCNRALVILSLLLPACVCWIYFMTYSQ
jgi:hypothetical protein